MADGLGLATLIVAVFAISLTLSPTSLNLLAGISSAALRAIWPPLGRCERLEWEDIPDGPLHTCLLPHCTHIGTDDAMTSWERTIVNFFRIRRGNFVRKPKQLSLGTTYIRTDTKTLKVFLSLLNMRAMNSSWTARKDSFRVVFKEVEGILTAYIQTHQSPPPYISSVYRLDVTKREMDLILEGYPPWFQNPLPLSGERSVPHPIRDQSDLSRGGWVVAVGLIPTLPVGREFMGRKNDSVIVVDRALGRLVHCLESLAEAFPGEERVSVAHELAEDVRLNHNEYSGSHLYSLFQRARFQVRDLPGRTLPDFTKELTCQQIVTTMTVFNQYEPLTSEQTTELRPVLENVLQAAMLGVYRVVKHLYVIGFREELPGYLPPQLKSDAFIYVRERWYSLED